MKPLSEQELTETVLDRLEATPDPRLREVMRALVGHLHAFASDVRLSESEWMCGIRFLTDTGQKCDDVRQEFILLSDTLGLSTLVDSIAHNGHTEATESTVLGPFYVPGAPMRSLGASVVESGPAGEEATVSGQVRSSDGSAIPGAELDVWQTAPNGLYDIQDPDQIPFNLRGRFRTDDDGQYSFHTLRPVDYPVPDDGPVGQLLALTGRHPWRAAHIHVIVSAPGHAAVTTHIFDSSSKYLESDTVFGVKESLVREFRPVEDIFAGKKSTHVEQDFVLRRLV